KHMSQTKRAFIGAVIAATAAVAVLAASPAQAAGGQDKGGQDKGGQVARASAVKADSVAPDRAGGRNLSSPAAEAAVKTLQARVIRYVADHGTGYTFAVYLDATTGRIVFNTTAPDTVVRQLTDLSSAPSAQRQAAAGRIE